MKLTLPVFKPTLTLNYAIVTVDTIISYISSTGYSCWSSDLNQTTRIAWSPHQLPYSVTLGTRGGVISCLPTQAPFRKPQTTQNQGYPLYTTFVVYLTTIGGQYLESKNFLIWKEGDFLRPQPSICFTKLKQCLETVKFF